MSIHTPHTNSDLLHRIAGGDERAFRQLYDLHWNRIFSTALTYTQSSHTAMDVVQETFIRVWKNREKLPDLDSVEAFIFVIARNRIKTILKGHRTLLTADSLYEQEIPDTDLSPERQAAIEQFTRLVHQATELLPAQQASVFLLSRFEHLSYEAIGERLGISPATVRNHQIKALNFLRTHFAHRHQELLFLSILLGESFLQFFFG